MSQSKGRLFSSKLFAPAVFSTAEFQGGGAAAPPTTPSIANGNPLSFDFEGDSLGQVAVDWTFNSPAIPPQRIIDSPSIHGGVNGVRLVGSPGQGTFNRFSTQIEVMGGNALSMGGNPSSILTGGVTYVRGSTSSNNQITGSPGQGTSSKFSTQTEVIGGVALSMGGNPSSTLTGNVEHIKGSSSNSNQITGKVGS